MMDFIMVPLVVGIVSAGIYGLFELFARRRERLAIIEKMGDKLDVSALNARIGLPRLTTDFSFSSLKAGCLLSGIGLGLLIGFIVSISCANNNLDSWGQQDMISTVYGASVLLFGGIGLIIAFVLEMKLSKEKKV